MRPARASTIPGAQRASPGPTGSSGLTDRLPATLTPGKAHPLSAGWVFALSVPPQRHRPGPGCATCALSRLPDHRVPRTSPELGTALGSGPPFVRPPQALGPAQAPSTGRTQHPLIPHHRQPHGPAARHIIGAGPYAPAAGTQLRD